MTSTALVITDVVVGGVLVAASLGRWRTSSGALLIASGGAWWLGDLVAPLTFLHRGFLIHLVLSHPGGRRAGTAVRVAVAAGYLYACVFPIARNDVASLVVAGAVGSVALGRHVVATGLRRRSTAFALAAACCLVAALAVGPVSRLAGVGTASAVLVMYDALVVGVAVLVMADMLRVGSVRTALIGLVVDLGRATGSDVLQGRLAAQLGDPGLVVGYWLPSTGRYTDDTGRPIELPAHDDRHTVTPLQVEGQPVAVLIHDSAAQADPRLLTQVAAAAKWAVGNVALRAQLQEQVDRVEASRRRIITAADTERRRLEEKLQRGPGHRLQRVSELITEDGSALSALASDVDRTRTQLNELARGLHPRTLTENGLPDALRELAARSPVPVRLDVPTITLPAVTKATLYFACAEALTNVLKYARASQVDVQMAAGPHSVTIVVTDNGVGGADPRRGTGLRGLADRVDALNGQLHVHSPAGSGTRVEVTLPLGPDQAPAATTTAP